MIRGDVRTHNARQWLFMREAQAYFSTVFEFGLEPAVDNRITPAICLLPQLFLLQGRHEDFLPADLIHLIANDRTNALEHA